MAKTDWLVVRDQLVELLVRADGTPPAKARQLATAITENIFGETDEMSPFDRILRLRAEIRRLQTCYGRATAALRRLRATPVQIENERSRLTIRRLKARVAELEKTVDEARGHVAAPDYPRQGPVGRSIGGPEVHAGQPFRP